MICKGVGIENVSRTCSLFQLEEALCDAERKEREPSILKLSAAVGNHSGDTELPEKKRTLLSQLPKKKNTCEVRKLQGLCLWQMLKASLFEISLERVKTTL